MNDMSTGHADWIAVDWGTSNLRAWAIGETGGHPGFDKFRQGNGQLSSAEFEPVLLGFIAPYLRPDTVTPVICCGMVGAKQAWREAPYQSVP